MAMIVAAIFSIVNCMLAGCPFGRSWDRDRTGGALRTLRPQPVIPLRFDVEKAG
jgi:hypothetical protein